jgi:mannose-1-phosphate guanylyltransferase
MIQETVERLEPLARSDKFWIITNGDLHQPILQQLPRLNPSQVLAEPVGRNTAPAIGLAAFILERTAPDAVIGMFPSDHVIVGQAQFRSDARTAAQIAAAGPNIVVMGIKPTRAETGYGYIEVASGSRQDSLPVRRFVEKPEKDVAEQFLATGNYFWNSGMFIWGAHTLADALREHLPKTAPILEQLAATYGSADFDLRFTELYAKCENISIDYAVLEPRSRKGEGNSGIFCVPATFGWNDLGSWTALYEHRCGDRAERQNIISSANSFTLHAEGNFVHSEKFVALVGVNDLVIVETEDALLITTRDKCQDVGKIVKYLDEKQLEKLV